jgi:methylase of polypeptide subunit release factors
LYGIDINLLATDWARRSLLLALWQLDSQGEQSHLRVPDFRANFVAADFLAPQLPGAFPQNFDVVLGGPPFVRYSQLKQHHASQLPDWRSRFTTARTGQFDLYLLFFEQAVRVLNPDGRLAWSCSNTFLRSKMGQPLRELLA